MKKIRLVTLFSGYDSQAMALERIKQLKPDFDYELVRWCEIDENAIKAHDLCFPEYKGRNLGDITKVDWGEVKEEVGDIDLLTFSSPCQDFSAAGLMKGGEQGSGTRSSLLWEVEKAIAALNPKYLMLENVKNLVSKKFKPLFFRWLRLLEDYGYKSYWKVLNAKDYGIPQNRERVFCISIRGDVSDAPYVFPEPFELKTKLKDVLEENVDDKYYLSEKSIEGFLNHNEKETKKYYGVSRSRDKKGRIVKREFKDYTMCVHAQVGGGRENMWVLIAEVYEDDGYTDMCDKREK